MVEPFREQFNTLDVTVHRTHGVLHVAIAGELDVASSQPLRDVIETHAGGDRCDVRIDCRELAFIDSSGLGLFVELHKKLQTARCSLMLVALPERCRQVFDVTGLTGLLTIE